MADAVTAHQESLKVQGEAVPHPSLRALSMFGQFFRHTPLSEILHSIVFRTFVGRGTELSPLWLLPVRIDKVKNLLDDTDSLFKMPMKVLVQQKASMLFLTDSDSWTRDFACARSFRNRTEATRVCREKRLFGVQAVLKFSTAGTANVILSIPP